MVTIVIGEPWYGLLIDLRKRFYSNFAERVISWRGFSISRVVVFFISKAVAGGRKTYRLAGQNCSRNRTLRTS